MLKWLTGAAAAACCAGAGMAAPAPVAPGAMSIPLGAFTLTALRDADNVVPNDGQVFGRDVGRDAVTAALAAAHRPTDAVRLAVDALLVRWPGHVVLIDSGLGPPAHGVLLRSLALAGVKPAEVTDVLLTHGHPDHLGGLLDAAGRPAFPKAVVRLSDAEWAAVRAAPDRAALVRALGGRVRPFRPGTEPLPGIMAVALPGHTPGHVAYRLASNGQALTDIGDTAHSSLLSLAHPDWTIGYDGDAAAGRATRAAELARLADTRTLVFAPHFPFPGFGRVVRRGASFAWVPLG